MPKPLTKKIDVKEVQLKEFSYEVVKEGEVYTIRTKNLRSDIKIGTIGNIWGDVTVSNKAKKTVLKTEFSVRCWQNSERLDQQLNEFLENIKETLLEKNHEEMEMPDIDLLFQRIFLTYKPLLKQVVAEYPKKKFDK
jgi:hypothetical protein